MFPEINNSTRRVLYMKKDIAAGKRDGGSGAVRGREGGDSLGLNPRGITGDPVV